MIRFKRRPSHLSPASPPWHRRAQRALLHRRVLHHPRFRRPCDPPHPAAAAAAAALQQRRIGLPPARSQIEPNIREA